MSPLDSMTPILVGGGQVTQRVADPADALEPLALMAQALERAADDAGSRDLLRRADSVRVLQGTWRYSNPAALLRERFGCDAAETVLGPIGGQISQALISDAARQIADGRLEIALVCGGETAYSRRRAEAAGIELVHTPQTGSKPDVEFQPESRFFDQPALDIGFQMPVGMFSLLENALRARRGVDLEAQRREVGELWARFSAVAADNPYAWIREPLSADQIATPGEGNPMIAWPYTKLLNANMYVDQAAGVIVTSVGAARRLGIPEHRWVYLRAAVDVPRSPMLSERDEYWEQPALRVAGRRVFALAELGPEAIDHVDLYSCFPSAVRLSAAELGFDAERPLTVTGGLTFMGGPLNNYVVHSVASMLDRVRDGGGSGLVSGVGGGSFAKHALAIYATEPGPSGFRYARVADELAELPTRALDPDYAGRARVESYCLEHARGEPSRALFACRLPDGGRAWARSEDAALLDSMTREEVIGRAARRAPDATLGLH